jgi:hypothetical protein
VSQSDEWPDDLAEPVSGVYRGPLEEFVARRDALVKELRGTGRRDEAERVKRLRKPTRTAWALDTAAHAEPATVEALVAAVIAMVEAQSGSGDLRQAGEQLRGAVHEVASTAARAAADGGHPVDPSLLAPAVMAVVGSVDAFEALRDGRLVDVPAGGGLDLLTGSLPMPRPAATRAPLPAPTQPQPADAGAVATARRTLEAAESAEADARDRAANSEQAVATAEADVEAAEDQLQRAEQEVRRARTLLRQAQQDAKKARQRARETTTAAAKARAKLDRLSG